RIDAATRRELSPPPRVGLGASSIASDGSSVWVAAKTAQRVVRIDARSGRVATRLRPGAPPWKLALGLGSLWVSTKADPGGQDQLIRYDASGGELARTTLPHGISGLTTDARFVWVTEQDVPNLLRIDPRTGRRVVWAKLAGAPSDLYYGGGYLWAVI